MCTDTTTPEELQELLYHQGRAALNRLEEDATDDEARATFRAFESSADQAFRRLSAAIADAVDGGPNMTPDTPTTSDVRHSTSESSGTLTPTPENAVRYFLAQDRQCYWWMVRADRRAEWESWVAMGGLSQLDPTDFAKQCSPSAFTFAYPSEDQ